MDAKIEKMIESFKENNIIGNTIKQDNQNNKKFFWPFIESPFFTDIEIDQLKNYYYESTEKESYHDYFNYESTINIPKNNNKSYSAKILDLQNQLNMTDDENLKDKIKQNIVDLGWNPEIEYTAESQKNAKNRFINLMNEKMCNIEFTDITSFIENYNNKELDSITESIHSSIHPISIVLIEGNSPISGVINKVTKSDYTHSALALDGDFTKLYSYNFDNKIKFGGGFSLESIKNYPKENKLVIFSFFINNKNYNILQEKLQYLLNNIKNTTYGVGTLLTYPFKYINFNQSDNMICSQFIDYCMKLINIDITNKSSLKVSPADLYNNLISKATVYKTYDGKVKNFNFMQAQKYLIKISKNAKLFKENNTINSNDIIPVIVEARKIPIEIKDNGDVLLTNPIPNFDTEYMNSHKLLMQYDKVKNIESMKYELARLYYINYILEKKLYSNNFLTNKTKNMKTRARVLNDFNKYIKIVLKEDPSFNFAAYYEQSPFYANTIEVKGSTIYKLKDLVDYIL